jgi:hypothetical protein
MCASCAKTRRQQHGKVSPDRVRRRVPEDLLGAAIEMHDPLRVVDRDDCVGGNRQNARELFLGCSRLAGDTMLGTKT